MAWAGKKNRPDVAQRPEIDLQIFALVEKMAQFFQFDDLWCHDMSERIKPIFFNLNNPFFVRFLNNFNVFYFDVFL